MLNQKMKNYINEIKYFNLQEFRLNNIPQWPTLFRWGAPFMLFFVLIYIFNNFYLSSIDSQISSLERDARNNLSEIEIKSQTKVNYETLEEQIEEINEHYKKTREAFPSEINANDLIKKLFSNHGLNNIDIQRVRMSDKSFKEFHNEKSISVTASGQYHGFGKFITHLANVREMFTIESFLMRPNENNLLLDIELKVYEQNESPVSFENYEKDKQNNNEESQLEEKQPNDELMNLI